MSEEKTCTLCCQPCTWESKRFKGLFFCNLWHQLDWEKVMATAPKVSDSEDFHGSYDPFD